LFLGTIYDVFSPALDACSSWQIILFTMSRLWCLSSARCYGVLFLAAGLSIHPCFAQTRPARPHKEDPSNAASVQNAVRDDSLNQHYQAARTFSVAGATDRAAGEYASFLGEALHRMANTQVLEGNFSEGYHFYEEANAVNPNDADLYLDYGTALFQQGDFDKAKVEADKAIQMRADNSKSQALLGRVLFAKGDYKGAKQHLEDSVKDTRGDVTFDVGYDLAITYLKLKDVNRASLLFDEMMIGMGNTPRIHIYFGHAYLMTDQYDRAISEFKEALQKDPKMKEAHYFLGLAYLSRDEDKGWDENAAEDRAEIENNPDDFRPHYDLGNIALHLHRTDEAERELKRASEIQPDNPDPLIALGEILISERKLPEAEAAMSKAIALTKDASRNAYQVNRAYYVLGRIQVETGRRELGVQNLKTAAELREKTQPQRGMGGDQAQTTAETAQQRIASTQPLRPAAGPSVIPPEQQKQLDAYFDQLKPAIADAYNNLGVAAGSHNDFVGALNYFRKAQQWYPTLETLDRNLGMSAFHAGNYRDAILPLYHVLERNPNDERVRTALGLSYFSELNYEGAVETLQSIEKQVAADPGAGTAYGVSLIKTGKYEQGIALLKSLEQANPNLAGIHAAMGETYADQGIYASAIEEYKKSLSLDAAQPRTRFLLGTALLRDGKPADAVPELRAALNSNPSDTQTKFDLALALLQSQQKDEAQSLLQEVIQQSPKYADAYYQLGKLQLESGSAKQAITSLESAAALSPRSDYIHYQLSLAYGRDARADDAQREMQLYQALKTERRGDHEQSRSD
jgi:tetratricopeptide (TPR) repeat protein